MIGERIQYLRCEKGLTQEQLGKELGLSTKTISFYEQERNVPDTLMIIRMAQYFNVTSDFILGLTNNRRPLDEKKAKNDDLFVIPHKLAKKKKARDEYQVILDYLLYKYENK